MVKGKKADPPDPAPQIEMMILEKDAFGNPFLPGQTREVIKELYEKAVEYEGTKSEHARLTKLLTEQKAELVGLSRKYREFFNESDDGTEFTYDCGGLAVIVDHEEKETVRTKAESSAKPDRKKKGETPEDIY